MLLSVSFIFAGASFAAEDANVQQPSWCNRIKMGLVASGKMTINAVCTGVSCGKKIICNAPHVPLATVIGLGYGASCAYNGDVRGYAPLVGFCAWQGYQVWKMVTLPSNKSDTDWVRYVLQSEKFTTSACLKDYCNMPKAAQQRLYDDIKTRINKTDAAQILQTMSDELEKRATVLMELDAQTGDFFAWIIKMLPKNVDRSSMTMKEKVNKWFGVDCTFKMVVDSLTRQYGDKYGFEIIDEQIENYLKSFPRSIIDVKMRRELGSYVSYPFVTGIAYNDNVRLCWRLLKEYTIISYFKHRSIKTEQNLNVTLFNGHIGNEQQVEERNQPSVARPCINGNHQLELT